MRYAVGQVWTYNETETCPQLILTVGRIDTAADLGADPGNSAVISVAIGVPETARENGWPEVGHLPFAEAALEGGGQVMAGVSLSDSFSEGYATWRAEFDTGVAGVFTLPPRDAYLAVVEFYAK